MTAAAKCPLCGCSVVYEGLTGLSCTGPDDCPNLDAERKRMRLAIKDAEETASFEWMTLPYFGIWPPNKPVSPPPPFLAPASSSSSCLCWFSLGRCASCIARAAKSGTP